MTSMTEPHTKHDTGPSLPESPWTVCADDVLKHLGVAADRGLEPAEVECRRRQFGPNRLREARTKSVWVILTDQFKSLVVGLLAAATVVSLLFGDWVEATAILVVIALNALIGFFTELQAVRSMEALRKLGATKAVVRRGGETREVDADELVPGDIVVLDAGDSVSADLRIVEASKLQADESMLTGESLPVGKQVEPISDDAPLAERKNMLYKGTFVTRGSGVGVAVGTGMQTELGRITALVEEAAGEETTPLEKRLDKLAHQLVWVTLVVAAVVAGLGILRGKDLFLMIETGVALAVAAIPEGLPIVATIALARGMLRMARRHALIRKLAAVETLGATNVICTDKTGTLTENRMTVTRILLDTGPVELGANDLTSRSHGAAKRQAGASDVSDNVLREALEVGVLCNNATLDRAASEESWQGVGDPMEVALLVAGAAYGIDRPRLIERFPEVREVAFDPDVKMMATFHRENGRFRVAVKGAPEPVLEACSRFRTADGETTLTDADRQRWIERNSQLAAAGLRILAVAEKTLTPHPSPSGEGSDDADAEPYQDLTFLGLIGMEDPPRRDVRDSLLACQAAGVRVVMVTGDQPVTAANVARQVGLVNEDECQVILGTELKSADEMSAEVRQRIVRAVILARVSPKQKLDLIDAHKRNGSIVAMTGDGVNDAPALEKADIGIAMGRRGTQVAREAADMVLEDDAFPTIVAAVEQGRVLFGNIRKFVVYLLSCNASEVMVVGLAAMVNAPLPVLPLQILFLNLVTDVFPALALGVGEGDPDVMKRPPRDPREPILPLRGWGTIGVYSLFITAAVLGALAVALLGLRFDLPRAVTVSFLTLAVAQLWHVFNMRDAGSPVFRNAVTRNRWVWGALALCAGMLILAVYVPVLAEVLKVKPPGWSGWAIILGMSALPWLAGIMWHAVWKI